MLTELIHPNGVNTVRVGPKQMEILLQKGWKKANPEPVADVVEFKKNLTEEVKDFIAEQGREASKEPEQEKPKPRNTVRKRTPAKRKTKTSKK